LVQIYNGFPWTTSIHQINTGAAIWRILKKYFALLVSHWRFLQAFLGKYVPKIKHFNIMISEITIWMLTKFVHVVESSPCNILQAASRSSNLLSNANAKSKGGG